MKYTKYFGLITKEQGRLNLSSEQFQRTMNIVHLEGVMLGLNNAKETYKDTIHYHKYDLIIFKYGNKLTELTGNLAPEMLLHEMVQFSD